MTKPNNVIARIAHMAIARALVGRTVHSLPDSPWLSTRDKDGSVLISYATIPVLRRDPEGNMRLAIVEPLPPIVEAHNIVRKEYGLPSWSIREFVELHKNGVREVLLANDKKG